MSSSDPRWEPELSVPMLAMLAGLAVLHLEALELPSASIKAIAIIVFALIVTATNAPVRPVDHPAIRIAADVHHPAANHDGIAERAVTAAAAVELALATTLARK